MLYGPIVLFVFRSFTCIDIVVILTAYVSFFQGVYGFTYMDTPRGRIGMNVLYTGVSTIARLKSIFII